LDRNWKESRRDKERLREGKREQRLQAPKQNNQETQWQ